MQVVVPRFLKLEDVRHNLSKDCTLQKRSLSKVQDSDNKELLALLSRKKDLKHEIDAIQAQSTLLKSLSLESRQDINTIEKLSDFLKKSLIANEKEIDGLSKQLKQTEEKIAAFPQKEFKHLYLEYTCNKDSGSLTLRYPQNARYSMFHTLEARPDQKAVNIKTKAKIFYKAGEDLSDADINLYSYAFNTLSAPRPFYPEYLGERKKEDSKQTRQKVMADAVMQSSQATNNINHNEDSTKSHYSISGVNLEANQDKLFDLDEETLDAQFANYIDAYGTNRAYIQATFTPKKQYQSAINTLLLDNMLIAKKHFPTFKKDKEAKVYFGENEHIIIEKELIKTLAEKTFFGDTRIATQNWQYTITNTKEYAEDIIFTARTPVSKDANIVVKTTAQPEFDEKTAKGKTQWNFTLEANASKELIFGYEIAQEED